MHPSLSRVKAVGFDLDRTLYPNTPEMRERIAGEIFKVILKYRPELRSLQRFEEIYKARCEELHSWSKVLDEIGIENSRGVVNACLDLANIADLIVEDCELVNIIEELHRIFFLFLITRSNRQQAFKKLLKIGIRPDIFNFTLFGDDPQSQTTGFAKNFSYFLSVSPFQPDEHVYIGDDPRMDIIPPKNLGMRTILVGEYSAVADFSVSAIAEIGQLLLT